MSKSNTDERTSEAEMADAVKSILQRRPGKRATFAEIFERVPDKLKLTKADKEDSTSRPGEPMWHQIVRNIKVHHREGFKGVAGGLGLVAASKPKQRVVKPAVQPEAEASVAA